jgi:hypothetical protein
MQRRVLTEAMSRLVDSVLYRGVPFKTSLVRIFILAPCAHDLTLLSQRSAVNRPHIATLKVKNAVHSKTRRDTAPHAQPCALSTFSVSSQSETSLAASLASHEGASCK